MWDENHSEWSVLGIRGAKDIKEITGGNAKSRKEFTKMKADKRSFNLSTGRLLVALEGSTSEET